MTSTFPDTVDVAIVGSGPCGAAYARDPQRAVPRTRPSPTFEVGPLLADPPGAHVKNIVDPRSGPARSAGRRGRAAGRRHPDRHHGAATPTRRPRLVRPGHLPAGRAAGSSRARTGCPARPCRATSAAWARTGPAPARGPGDSERIAFLPDLDELLAEAERLLGVDAHAFDDAPFADEVRKRLGGALDADARRGPPGRADAAGGAAGSADGRVTWSGSDVVFGEVDPGQPELHRCSPRRWSPRSWSSDGRATGVRVRDLRTGDEHVVAARFVVVAADALRTPQLLWASGVRPARARPVPQRPAADGVRRPAARRRARARGGRSTRADEPAIVAAERGQLGARTPTTSPFHGQVMQLDASPVPLAGDDVPTPGHASSGSAGSAPRTCRSPTGSSSTTTEVDGYGMPAMRIHYRLTERDHASIAAARATRPAGGRRARRAARTTSRSPSRRAPRCTTRAPSGWAPPTTAPRSAPRPRQVWGVDGPLRRRQRRHPHRHRLQPHPHLASPSPSPAPATSPARSPKRRSDHARRRTSSRAAASATCSRTAGSPASSSSCATPTTAGSRPACSTASTSSSTASGSPEHVPLWTLQGRTLTLDELRASTDVRWQLDEPATITVPKPGGLVRRRAPPGGGRAPAPVLLPADGLPHAVHARRGTGVIVPPAPEGGLQVRRLHLQLHPGHLHLDDAGGRVRRHRRPRRHRHRDPRRGQHPELPDAVLGVDRRVARAAGAVRADADQLRVLGRHHPLARPRPDRRGGRRADPAGPAAGQAARLHLGAAEVRRHLAGSWTRTRSGRAPSSGRWTWPPSWTSSSARRSTRRRRSSTR